MNKDKRIENLRRALVMIRDAHFEQQSVVRHDLTRNYMGDVAYNAILEDDRIANQPSVKYDKTFGDERMCVCGHIYFRHFDAYDSMRPVGCKYVGSCGCTGFKEAKC